MNLRWDPCVSLLGAECEEFFSEYLDQPGHHCLLIGGAGFDPRTTIVAQRMSRFSRASVRGLFFREERTMPQPKLRPLAEGHQAELSKLLPGSDFPPISIFAEGVTPTGGRVAAQVLNKIDLGAFTDIIVDISALSSGVFFPTISLLLRRSRATQTNGKFVNLQLLTVEEPRFDHRIRGLPCESPTLVHGYRGKESLDATANKARLWIPTLAPGTQAVLKRIYHFLSRAQTPIDVSPIIPFPGHDPKMPDRLIWDFKDELLRWGTDFRNLFYAAESDPLDAYRTICSVHAARERTFSPLGGSTVVLSPVGNKLLAVGAMLAAIEKDLHVVLIESVGYDEEAADLSDEDLSSLKINGIWLQGEAYRGRTEMGWTGEPRRTII